MARSTMRRLVLALAGVAAALGWFGCSGSDAAGSDKASAAPAVGRSPATASGVSGNDAAEPAGSRAEPAGSPAEAGARALQAGDSGRAGGAGSTTATSGASAGAMAGGAGGAGGTSAFASDQQGGTASPPPSAAPRTFRITELYLRDPHLFLGQIDITEQSVLGVSVNADLIKGGLTTDYDGDGFVDVSILATLMPYDPSASSGMLQLRDGRCATTDPQKCEPHPMPGLDAMWNITAQPTETCLRVSADTTGGYSPKVVEPAGPCFVTRERRDVAVVLGGVRLAMTDTQLAATYDRDSLRGLIMGFVTQAKAEEALLPSYLPLLGNTPITDYLRDSDRDRAHSPNGDDGFWFYVNFVAEPVH